MQESFIGSRQPVILLIESRAWLRPLVRRFHNCAKRLRLWPLLNTETILQISKNRSWKIICSFHRKVRKPKETKDCKEIRNNSGHGPGKCNNYSRLFKMSSRVVSKPIRMSSTKYHPAHNLREKVLIWTTIIQIWLKFQFMILNKQISHYSNQVLN